MRPMYPIPSTAPKPPLRPPVQKPPMEPVEVFCRIRPLEGATPLPTDGNNNQVCVYSLNDKMIELIPPPSAGEIAKAQTCTFTSVFDEVATQQLVFDRVACDLVSDLVQGKNGLLFTYGVTGSGKTYTMTGNPHDLGILPRSLDVLFNSVGKFLAPNKVFKSDTKTNTFMVQSEAEALLEDQKNSLRPAKGIQKLPISPSDFERRPRDVELAVVPGVDEDNGYAVFVSYFQIYNNYIYDLLDPESAKESKKYGLPPSKLLREDMEHKMFVSCVTEEEVRSTEEACDKFLKGQRLRRTAHTFLNTESNRSHTVFNIRLIQAPLDASGRNILQDPRKIHVSQLSLVDLAGSERANRTLHVGERMREAGNINESLMTLRQCIEQLRENQKTGAFMLVPYRNSRLTHLFKNYFDGEGKVRMIVCINPSAAEYEENKHVMDFAELTQEVEVPRAGGFRFPEPFDDVRQTPGRRRAAANSRPELELTNATPLPQPVMFPAFGADFPSINLESLNLNDGGWLQELRETQCKRRQELATACAQTSQELEEMLQQYINEHEALKLQYEQKAIEFMKQEEERIRLRSEMQDLQRRNRELELKVAEYERNAKRLLEEGRQLTERERDMEGQVRHQDQILKAVKDILENPLSSLPPISPRSQADPAPVSKQRQVKAATVSTLRLGTVVEKGPIYPKFGIPVFSPNEIWPLQSRRSILSSRGQILATTAAGARTQDRREAKHRRRALSGSGSHEALFTTDSFTHSQSDDETDVVMPQYHKRKSAELVIEETDAPSTSRAVIGILKKSKH